MLRGIISGASSKVIGNFLNHRDHPLLAILKNTGLMHLCEGSVFQTGRLRCPDTHKEEDIVLTVCFMMSLFPLHAALKVATAKYKLCPHPWHHYCKMKMMLENL